MSTLTRSSLLPLLAAVVLWGAPPQARKPPNILFIFADDHAYQAISAYGSRINHTPNIDRLAREGMLFRNAMVTNSICAPSRAVILTGKYSHLNGVIDNAVAFDGAQQTFPKLLQKAGYQTALFGKWHLKTDPTGFDAWEILPGQGSYYNPDMLVAGGKRRHEGYVTDIITDLTLDWLRHKRDPNRPFLVMTQHKAPHREWMPAPEHLTLYAGIDVWEPPTLFDDYTGRASPARHQQMEIARHMRDDLDLKLVSAFQGKGEFARMTEKQKRAWDAVYGPENEAFFRANLAGRDLVRWKYQRYIKDYLRCIASVDDNVGRLLRYLDEEGLAADTVVIYSSDQGFYLGEHGWFDKRWMYQESLKTPLIVRWPGVTRPGSEDTHLVANLDLPETFLEIAGVAVPPDMQGRSLAPLLRGEAPRDWRKSFYYHYYEGPPAVHAVARHYGVVTRTHKLIHYYETGEWELFDLELDPHELHSVYGDPRYERITRELQEELARLRAALQVPDVDPDRQKK
jgi:arylsulfatase A-like enzyme